MSIVRINAIDVPADQADEFARRFAARAGAVEKSPGFEEFQLLRPTDSGGRWFVVTRWESQEAFDAWVASNDFAKAHAHAGDSAGKGHGHGGAAPVATGSELLSFEVVERVLPTSG